MSEDKIERAALGRIGKLGDLYDARSDSFCGIPMFKTAAPPSAVTTTDNNLTDMKFLIGDSMSGKFSMLDVSAELSASFLGGQCPVSGSAKYLNTRKDSKRAGEASLLYNINTKVDQLNLFDSQLLECISQEALKHDGATHVVTEVYWGANSLMTVKDENQENEDITKIEGHLSATLKLSCVQISGKMDGGLDEKTRTKSSSYSFEIFGDVLADKADQMPTNIDDAIAMMKHMPELVQKANAGKGKPLKYVLFPLSAKSLREHMKMSETANVILRSIDSSAIQESVNVFNEIAVRSQEVNDYIRDIREMEQTFHCVPIGTATQLKGMSDNISSGESKLREKFAVVLKSVRAGKDDMTALESLISEYLSSENSASKLADICREKYEALEPKRHFIKRCQKYDVSYTTKANDVKIDVADLDEAVVFYANEKSKTDEKRWSENMNMFFEMAKQSKSGGSTAAGAAKVQFLFVDCDFDSVVAAQKGIRIERYVNGKCVDDDLASHGQPIDKTATEKELSELRGRVEQLESNKTACEQELNELRKRVKQLLESPIVGELFITVDNTMELFIDGVRNPISDELSAKDFTVTKRVKLPVGSRVIAVRAVDYGAQAGLLASATCDALLSDATWKVSTVEADGWTRPEFDDSKWQQATEHGLNGVDPWKTFNLISLQAKWIWTPTKFYADTNAHPVYFRYRIDK